MSSAKPIRATAESLKMIREYVPAELLELPRWVGWDGVLTAKGKVSKAPRNPNSGYFARTNKPDTWANADTAHEFALRDPRIGGLGLVLTNSDYWALDLDHVIDLKTGELDPAAKEFLDRLGPTYMELSPSGDGLHVIFRGKRPAALRRTKAKNAFGEGKHLEVFGGKSARFLTMTGVVWEDAEIQPASLETMHAIDDLFPDEQTSGRENLIEPSADLDTEERKVRCALRNIASDDYDDWIKVGMALRGSFPDAQGFGIWIDWSEKAHNYDIDACNEHWRSFKSPDGGVTLGSVYWLASQQEPGWRDRWRHEETARVFGNPVKTGGVAGESSGYTKNPAATSGHEHSDQAPVAFPITALPRNCRTMVQEGAKAQGVDVAFWGVPLLGILAGCIGNSRTVGLKKGWEEPCVLWIATIAPSGAGKSPPLRALKKPATDADQDLYRQNKTTLAKYAAELEAWKRAKKDDKGPKPTAPQVLALVVTDVTLEGLLDRLADNPRGLMLVRDELAGWLKSFDQYRGSGGDEQAWLSIHGADAAKVDRKGSAGSPKQIFVPRAAVSVIGTIQPSVARLYIGNAENLGSGLAARILLAQPPTSVATWTQDEISAKTSSDYSDSVRALLALNLVEDRPVRLELSDQAQTLFVTYHDELGRSCDSAVQAGDESFAAVLSKLRGTTARIALVLALTRAAEDGDASLLTEIDATAMSGAIALVRYFEVEARRIYWAWRMGSATKGPSNRSSLTVTQVADSIKNELRKGPKSRSELRDTFSRNVSSELIGQALTMLQLLDEAACTNERSGEPGRPREVWSLCAGGEASS